MLVIPAIDIKDGMCVRLRQGRLDEKIIYCDDPIQVACLWQRKGAKWLHVVDLDAAFGDAGRNADLVARLLRAAKIPVQIGGGLRTIKRIEHMIKLGAARVVIGTAAIYDPALLRKAIEMFGERIVVSLDARDGIVATEGWAKESGQKAVEVAIRLKGSGLKRVVYTDIAQDGTMAGINVQAAVEIAEKSGLVVIASGGVSSLDDLARLKRYGRQGIEGVIIGRALYEGAIDLEQALAIAGD